jgi:hypothetical protein
MSNDMKLIMESWRRNVLSETIQNPDTWGELAANILFTKAAQKWPRLGKSLLKFGVKLGTGAIKGFVDSIEEAEQLLDYIPNEWEEALENGTEKGVEALSGWVKSKGGTIGAFVIDDIMGMDDSLTKNLPGFDQLNIEDEYEDLVKQELLKKFAKRIMRYAQKAPPDEKLPDLNREFELFSRGTLGAHPDVDGPDVRKKEN